MDHRPAPPDDVRHLVPGHGPVEPDPRAGRESCQCSRILLPGVYVDHLRHRRVLDFRQGPGNLHKLHFPAQPQAPQEGDAALFFHVRSLVVRDRRRHVQHRAFPVEPFPVGFRHAVVQRQDPGRLFQHRLRGFHKLLLPEIPQEPPLVPVEQVVVVIAAHHVGHLEFLCDLRHNPVGEGVVPADEEKHLRIKLRYPFPHPGVFPSRKPPYPVPPQVDQGGPLPAVVVYPRQGPGVRRVRPRRLNVRRPQPPALPVPLHQGFQRVLVRVAEIVFAQGVRGHLRLEKQLGDPVLLPAGKIAPHGPPVVGVPGKHVVAHQQYPGKSFLLLTHALKPAGSFPARSGCRIPASSPGPSVCLPTAGLWWPCCIPRPPCCPAARKPPDPR